MRRAFLGSLLIHAAAFGAALFALAPGAGRGAPRETGVQIMICHAPEQPEPPWQPPPEPPPAALPPEPEQPADLPEMTPPMLPEADEEPLPPPPEPRPSTLAYRLRSPLRRFEAPPAAPAPPPPAAAAVRQEGPLVPPRRIPAAVEAPYPARARSQGIEGRVVLRLHVSAAGEVVEAVVARSSGHDVLDDAAVKSARELRFEPARRDGAAVACWVAHAVDFRLTG